MYATAPTAYTSHRNYWHGCARHSGARHSEAANQRSRWVTLPWTWCAAPYRPGQGIKLSPREYDLLRLSVSHAGKVLTRDFILHEAWGPGANVQYLRIYIRALRQKIEMYPASPLDILTETGVGYRLRAPGWSALTLPQPTGTLCRAGLTLP
jgi:DNA-binding response OmpR family regulator